jgi:hypothetical protein
MSIPCGVELIEETAPIVKIRDVTIECGCKVSYYAPDREFYYQLSDWQLQFAYIMKSPVTKTFEYCEAHK